MAEIRPGRRLVLRGADGEERMFEIVERLKLETGDYYVVAPPREYPEPGAALLILKREGEKLVSIDDETEYEWVKAMVSAHIESRELDERE